MQLLATLLVLASKNRFHCVLAAIAVGSIAAAQTPLLNPANGHYYGKVSAPGLTWLAAKSAAEALTYNGAAGHLATITDAAENQWIATHIPASGLWIGGVQNHGAPNYSEPAGGWTWVTGEAWSYTNWAAAEPNNICCGGEDWLELQYDFLWNDNYNTNTGLSGYLVEYDYGFVVYCTSGTSSTGCVPSISATGIASAASSSGFTVAVTSVEGLKQGILFYGINNTGFTPSPWAAGSTSYLCVKNPAQRTGSQNSGGTFAQCDGAISLDWNAYKASHPNALGSPFVAGRHVFMQGWFRDPPSPKTTMLSNAVEFVVAP